MGANIIKPKGAGPCCFRIQGQVYHHASPLHSDEPAFAQLYILDPAVALAQRLEINNDCDPDVLFMLGNILSDINPIAHGYKSMHELEQDLQITTGPNNNTTMPNLEMVFVKNSNHDQHRFNIPTSNEIAFIFKTKDGGPPDNRDLLTYPKNSLIIPSFSTNKTKRISDLLDVCDPMTYPLFFPYGELGWNEHMLQTGKYFFIVLFYLH